MSAYARMCVQLGAEVSGSDRAESPALARLRELGVAVHVGHDAANVPPEATVFYSSAGPADNPERVAGARPRAELLRELSAGRFTIAVGGAHGKTTTTSMAAHVLLRCGLEPGYLIGGALRTTGEHADLGAGRILVVEADESDRSLLAIETDVAVVLNVELDHHATYGSLAEVEAVFAQFVAAAPHRLLGAQAARALGGEALPEPGDLRLEPGGSTFAWRGHQVHLAVPGAHNAANAIAALEACVLAGADAAAAAAALADFAGAGRRFERVGETPRGAVVVDDSAHHPTEVAATIAAARSLAPRRLVAVFQPHLFSRTRELHREFGAALARADLPVVLDIYPARERAEDFPGVDGMLIARSVGREVLFLPTLEDAEAVLGPRLGEGDLVLVMGAGDVDRLGRALVADRDRRNTE
ncbi:MAG: UDP-N-acetylmuramate--L-alanine ligase [Solirubrobacterales bacterium]|nr:UDP-N-acetylmuramate--L-alanine ligase [Solirubrobacterales bacterium]